MASMGARRGPAAGRLQREAKPHSAAPRHARLHDARHTAATVLLILGVPERTVMGVMGWSSTSMASHYQHMTDPIRRDVAARVGGLIWARDPPDFEPTETKTETRAPTGQGSLD
jgi:integrase